MRIITNTGSNLSQALVKRYDITVTAQQVVADGLQHDTRTMSLDDVDKLVRSAGAHPHILGTSASELVMMFRDIAKRDRELVMICTSRKLIGTYDAALAATRTLQSMPAYADVQISVIDSMLTDLGTGTITLFCAESAVQRHPRRAIADAARTLAEHSCFYFVPTNSDYLIKSGRASFIKSMASELLSKLPVIASRGGELHDVGTMQKNGDMAQTLVACAAKDYPQGQSIFASITYAKHPREAEQLEALLRERYDVKCMLKREVTPTIYLTTGEGLGCTIMPTKGLPWHIDLPSERFG